jgi:competence protein ComEC
LKKSSEVYSAMILNSNLFIPPYRVRLIFLIASIIFLGPVYTMADAGKEHLRIHVIDVGYGDAIVLELPGDRTMMIDAGDKENASKVVDYLQNLNVHTIDRAVITHPHLNHFEGFFEVLKSVAIDHVYVNGDENAEVGYERLLEGVRKNNISIEVLRRGNRIDDLHPTMQVEVLHPQGLSGSPNDNSLVLWLTHHNVSILLMADVQATVQEALIDLYPKISTADIVKLPHHGGPLSEALLRAFSNTIFVISTGPNRWGWPREDELAKLNGQILRTDVHGSVIIESDGMSVSVTTEDQEKGKSYVDGK